MRDINYLTPKVRALYSLHVKACEDAGIRVFPTFTLRTASEHKAIYAQGRAPLADVNRLRYAAGMAPLRAERDNRVVSWAKRSPHLAGPDGLSRAYDLAIRGPLGAIWDLHYDADADGKPEWQEVAELGRALGLTSGFYWRVKDCPHFELSYQEVYGEQGGEGDAQGGP